MSLTGAWTGLAPRAFDWAGAELAFLRLCYRRVGASSKGLG